MLAIQYTRMLWRKENRTPEGAVARREYFKPIRIEDEVQLEGAEGDSGGGIFLQKRWYIQSDKIYPYSEYNRLLRTPPIKTYELREESLRKYLMEHNRREKEDRGLFLLDVKDVDIPGIEIKVLDEGYEIIWYSLEKRYQPVRTGYNQKYHVKGSTAQGKRLKCETAFVLKKGEAGVVKYNYRYTSYSGQHYEQFCIYFVNVDELRRDSFVKADYTKVYDEMADLF
ncbi:MAG: hypothetical protein IJ794_04390 [Lachnospiraceae bacterium]|nr:hypothetical protein [Lachnospiraceae bacterium]